MDNLKTQEELEDKSSYGKIYSILNGKSCEYGTLIVSRNGSGYAIVFKFADKYKQSVEYGASHDPSESYLKGENGIVIKFSIIEGGRNPIIIIHFSELIGERSISDKTMSVTNGSESQIFSKLSNLTKWMDKYYQISEFNNEKSEIMDAFADAFDDCQDYHVSDVNYDDWKSSAIITIYLSTSTEIRKRGLSQSSDYKIQVDDNFIKVMNSTINAVRHLEESKYDISIHTGKPGDIEGKNRTFNNNPAIIIEIKREIKQVPVGVKSRITGEFLRSGRINPYTFETEGEIEGWDNEFSEF